MGYRCPVCGDPQADGRHLANHLAFTALVRGGDHEAWLDERVPGWAEMDDGGLAGVVTDHAEETEYPRVFEDTTGRHDQREHRGGRHGDSHGGDHGHGGGTGPPGDVPVADLPDEEELSAEAAEAIERARELTRERRESEGEGE